MARLALSLLGTFQATLDGQPIRRFRVNTARALLAYLAVEADRPHHRETLAGLLWPDVANTIAMNNLRHALSDLRKAIGDTEATAYLHITRHTLQFNFASDSWLDTQAFRNGVQSDDPVQQAQAIELYRGPFLDGFSLNTSPTFEEWLIVRQQQYHQLAVIALRQLADRHIQRGEYPAAQRHVQHLLELEPWH
jgi:DNA-binding SARP family transcriptional activator